jgi:hypothetical protein
MSCGCSNSKKVHAAVITPVLAAGSVASPYFVQVNISQRLCKKACVNQPPVFNPVFSLVGYDQVGTGQYVATVKVEGVVAYTPCDTNGCCDKTQVISQVFTIPFASTAAPTSVTITQGVSVNAIAAGACQDCSRSFVSETPVILTVA